MVPATSHPRPQPWGVNYTVLWPPVCNKHNFVVVVGLIVVLLFPNIGVLFIVHERSPPKYPTQNVTYIALYTIPHKSNTVRKSVRFRGVLLAKIQLSFQFFSGLNQKLSVHENQISPTNVRPPPVRKVNSKSTGFDFVKRTNVNLLLFYSTKLFFYSDDSPYSQRFFKVIQREK